MVFVYNILDVLYPRCTKNAVPSQRTRTKEQRCKWSEATRSYPVQQRRKSLARSAGLFSSEHLLQLGLL